MFRFLRAALAITLFLATGACLPSAALAAADPAKVVRT
jgi:hypothetical protein